MVHYARWMVAHERPYLDRPEDLEYPTESWAAHELRKPNVVRIASKHAAGEESQRFIECADRWSRCAWHDLLSFPTRAVARSLAIMMVEGTIDAFWRSNLRTPEMQVTGTGVGPIREPSRPFVPQRARVRRDAMVPLRAIGMLVRLATPRKLRWMWAIWRREAAARFG